MMKRNFYIYQEDLIKYNLTEETVTISKLVTDLNIKYCENDMKKLRTKQITDFLVKQGYLYKDSNLCKRPTPKGKVLGIIVGKVLGKDGEEHIVNLYNKRAQEYILDNIYDMI